MPLDRAQIAWRRLFDSPNLVLFSFRVVVLGSEWNEAEEELADAERWEDDWDDDDVSDDDLL